MKIALYGASGVGKSHVANIFKEEFDFKELAFADPIYALAKKHFNMQEKDRKILVGIGEACRDLQYNVWVDKLHEARKELKDENVVVSDLRRFNEYYYLIAEGFIPIKIVTQEVFVSQGKNNTSDLLLQGHTKGELDDVPMITLENTTDQKGLKESVKLIVDQYDVLYEARFKGGQIKYDK